MKEAEKSGSTKKGLYQRVRWILKDKTKRG